jgi:NTP pyrophosphatase (non-canonical NTP hydrolase)
MSDLGNLIEMIRQFVSDRNWKQFHNPKDLSTALSIEASELLENFLWKSSDTPLNEAIKDELADVLIYALMISDHYDLDINEIIRNKVIKNVEKYPIEKSKDSSKKYDEI